MQSHLNIPHSTSERFWAKINKTDTCWLWIASCTNNGYGQFRTRRGKVVTYLAHRFAYEMLAGPIPSGLTLDHLCRVRQCVNPSHLEPVTNRENLMRGIRTGGGVNKTHCLRGHPFDEINTYRKNGRRHCRTCRNQYMVKQRGRQT